MKNNKNIIDRGALLKKVADESDLTVEAIISRMNYSSRATFYSHLKKADLSLVILKKYGKVLKYDFSQDIDEITDLIFEEEPIPILKEPKSLEEAVSQRDYYFRLYMDSLETIRTLQDARNLGKTDSGKKNKGN